LISEKLKNIKTLVLLAGPGSGSKLFQSYIDGHNQVLMTPGYILMYFYPHWKKYLKDYKSWKKIIDHFLKLHPSILDSNKMKGGDYLYNLGDKKNKNIKINKNKFKKCLLKNLSGEKINSHIFFLAIHIAYATSIGENLDKKKILVYHMHVCWYLKDFLKDFSTTKTVTMIRDLKSNIPNRIPALEKPNTMHLNYTDAIFFKTRSYRNIIFEDFFSLDYLKKFKNTKHVVVKHEDLLDRKKKVLQFFCKYAGISFSPAMLSSTTNRLKWNYRHDKKIKLTNGVAQHIKAYNVKNFFYHDLYWLKFLTHTFNKKYKYISSRKKINLIGYILTLIFILIPSKKEFTLFFNFFNYYFIKSYFCNLYKEAFVQKIKLYEKNAFYHHKWSNKFYPFNLINFFNKKINLKKSFFWQFSYLSLKSVFFFLFPLVLFCEYLIRIIFCYNILIKNILSLRFYPKKI